MINLFVMDLAYESGGDVDIDESLKYPDKPGEEFGVFVYSF